MSIMIGQINLLFLNVGGGEAFMIVLVILVLFGGKGVPTIARTLGKGIREFKDATEGIKRDIQEGTGNITQHIQEPIQEVKKTLDENTK